jgi:hypothetical protein
MNDPTTIQVDKTTRTALKNIGAKGETYDAIIRRLIVAYGGGPWDTEGRGPWDTGRDGRD